MVDLALTRDPALTQPLAANPITAAGQKNRALHWLIAVLLHVPVVYVLLAITVADTRSNETALEYDAGDDLAPAVVFSPTFELPAQTGLRRAELAEPVVSTPASRDASNTLAEATEVPATRDALQRMSPATPPAPALSPRANPVAEAPRIERARFRILTQLAPVNDSIAQAQRAKQDADDMTITDRNGNRWGISRGALHLGDKTIRLAYATNGGAVPDVIVPSPGKRDEVNALKRSWLEIEMQSSRALINTTFNQRATDMRQRRDSARVNALATMPHRERRED